MDRILQLELTRNREFTYSWRGRVYTPKSPQEMTLPEIFDNLDRGILHDTPHMPYWKAQLVGQQWAAFYDLPSIQAIQRAAFLVGRYYDAIEYDLRTVVGADVDELWQTRQWRRLLNFIDRLPPNSHYREAVDKDPEHVEAIRKAVTARREQGEPDETETRPPIRTWSPELEMLATMNDNIKRVSHTIAQSKSKQKIDPPKPTPRPSSALARVFSEFERRKASHEALTKRLLPHKR